MTFMEYLASDATGILATVLVALVFAAFWIKAQE